MAEYRNILIAVDLSTESEVVIEKARLIGGDDAVFTLVYLQEPMDNIYVGIVP